MWRKKTQNPKSEYSSAVSLLGTEKTLNAKCICSWREKTQHPKSEYNSTDSLPCTGKILNAKCISMYDRSVLRFSFACGLRPHAKLNPRTPLACACLEAAFGAAISLP